MANFNEETAGTYDWETGGVYVIEETDPVEGGPEGISNRQGWELAHRTRNLHERLSALKHEADNIAAELSELTEAVDTKTAAALRSAKEYTDTRETAILAQADTKDAAALRSAKEYADQVVAALVDGSPEALNTLQELAAALGGDPNFATTVMQLIGERATMAQVNAALEGKADVAGSLSNMFKALCFEDNQGRYNIPITGVGYTSDVGQTNTHRFCTIDYFKTQLGLWHTGNFDPAGKFGILGNDILADDAEQGAGYCYTKGSPTHGIVATFKGLSENGPYGSFQLFCDNQTSNNARFWARNNNQQGFTPWRELYHSGNLDGAKLDALPPKIIAGSVYENGIVRKGGALFSAEVSGEYIRVTHHLGHTNYIVTASVFAAGNTNYRDNTVSTMTQAAGYFDLSVTSISGNVERCIVDFVLVCI